MTTDTDNAVIACSFCLKPSTEVAKLVAGHGVYICDKCVALCSEIIRVELQAQPSAPRTTDPADQTDPPDHADRPPQVAPWKQQTSLDEILAALPQVAAAGQQAQAYLAHWVHQARSLGATWAQIGAALDMTRQSAWERFSGEE